MLVGRRCHPRADFLPYGGEYHGLEGVREHAARWLATWGLYQGQEERKPSAICWDAEDYVVAIWRLRAGRPDGERLAARMVGVYGVSDGRVAEAQMFYSDQAAVLGFLSQIAEPTRRGRRREPASSSGSTAFRLGASFG